MKNELKKHLVNRELSWLSFNERVLQQAQNPKVPLIQRLRFLGIFSSNLDEFFRVRVGTLKRLAKVDKTLRDSWGEKPKAVLRKINAEVVEQRQAFEACFDQIKQDLKTEGIHILNEKQLNKAKGKLVQEYFREKIRAALTPIMLQSVNEFPRLKDNTIYLAIKMHNGDASRNKIYSILKVPSDIFPRFFVIEEDEKKNVILLDDVIRYNLKEIFPIFNYKHYDAYTIKVTRDAELDIDNDISRDFLDLMTKTLKERSKGRAVRVVYDDEMPSDLLSYITSKLKLNKEDNKLSGMRYHNFKDFIGFPDFGRKDLAYGGFKNVKVPKLLENKSVFQALNDQDIMLYYPYHSFNHVIDMLREAAIDPKVRSIKISLYRVADHSNVVNALINAARNGKKVTVVIELLARFDEQANIFWSGKLKEEGIEVLYGVPGYKVHCKVVMIERVDNGRMKRYCNFSTGNYNESTAKFYCDHSLFTSNKGITRDAARLFEMIESQDFNQEFDKLIVAPKYLRPALVDLIDNEIMIAKKGRAAKIDLKLNNLVDEGIIDKLYEAGQAGVKIRIVVRGICSLIANKEGLSENIHAVSIVDKFLEHSRFYIFGEGTRKKVFISSADLMTRNLDNRVEVTTPILQKDIQDEIQELFELQWNDNVSSRWINESQDNQYKKGGSKTVRAQTKYLSILKSKVKEKY